MSRNQPHGADRGAIQRAGLNLPSKNIGGPELANIQIVDVPANASGSGAGKQAGINVMAAVLRRWWLVLIVGIVIGGSGFIAANRLVSQTYEAKSTVLYHAIMPAVSSRFAVATDPADVIRTHIELLTKPDIALLAARNSELQQALPWLKGADLDNPAVQKDVVRRLKGVCEIGRA